MTRAREEGFSYRRDLLDAVRAELARTAPPARAGASARDDDEDVSAPASFDPYAGLGSWGGG